MIMDNTYYVCHGPDVVHYVESYGASTMTSGQPNIEQFDDEQEAKARAEELGYVFTIGGDLDLATSKAPVIG
jgi:hypothetical protein